MNDWGFDSISTGFRVLVCGGRDYDDQAAVDRVLSKLTPPPKLLIHGGATGADALAASWAADRGIEVVVCPADWVRHGRAAGPVRNQAMLDDLCPDLVVAFPGGRGTADMVRRARAAGVPVLEVDDSAAESPTSPPSRFNR